MARKSGSGMSCSYKQILKILNSSLIFDEKHPIISTSKYMVGVAQLVEHQVVVLGVAGSKPVAHPIHKEHEVFIKVL